MTYIQFETKYFLYVAEQQTIWYIMKQLFMCNIWDMNMDSDSEISSLEDACKKVLKMPKIRFVGVLNNMGRKIAGSFRKGITSYLEDNEDHMMYVQLTFEYLMRKDFDKKLGPIDYIVSQRKKVVLISIPTRDYLVLISADRGADVLEIINEVNKAFTMLPDIRP